MCLIVDANRAYHLFDDANNSLGKAIVTKLAQGEMRIATGGKNLDELIRSKPSAFPKLVQEFNRSGWLVIYNREKLKDLSNEILGTKQLRSNDVHNIALAIISGAHVLLSNDNNFIADFKDSRIVPIRRNCKKTVFRDDGCAPRLQPCNCCGCHS